MRERLRLLRTTLGLTLEQMGGRLRLHKTALSKIERGENGMGDRLIAQICGQSWDGKRVSEQWLRTGDGEMFRQQTDDEEIIAFAERLVADERSPVVRKIILAMARVPYECWDEIESAIKSAMDN